RATHLRLTLRRPTPHPRHSTLPYTTLFRSTGCNQTCGRYFIQLRAPTQRRLTIRRSAGSPRSTIVAQKTISAPTVWERASHQNRSEEHTSELQSRGHLVCRLLPEKKTHIPT